MRVYVAYKYRAVKDKDELIKDLELVSGAIATLEHSHFILGRDVQKWHGSSSSVFKTVPHILANIIKSDMLFVYVNSEVCSNGLLFELVCATVLGKPLIVAKKQGVKFDLKWIKPKQIVEFSDIQDLVGKIKTIKEL